jgi:hypothetical protein
VLSAGILATFESLMTLFDRKGVFILKKLLLLITLVITTMISSASVAQAATLTIGSSGSEVRLLQSELKTLYYSVGSVDGINGI